MRLTWRETIYPSRPVSLDDVAARLAEGIRQRGPFGPPLAFGDRPGVAVVEDSVVKFDRTPFGRLTNGTIALSGSASSVVAECSVGLPRTLPFVLGLAAVVVAVSLLRGTMFDGEVALVAVWLIGGWYLFLRWSLRFRLLDLLKAATAPPAPAA